MGHCKEINLFGETWEKKNGHRQEPIFWLDWKCQQRELFHCKAVTFIVYEVKSTSVLMKEKQNKYSRRNVIRSNICEHIQNMFKFTYLGHGKEATMGTT